MKSYQTPRQIGRLITSNLKIQIYTLCPQKFSSYLKIWKVCIWIRQKWIPCDTSFEKAVKLRHLSLDRNEIQTLKSNGFSGCRNLEGLYLSNNQLENLESGTFNGIVRLQELSLDRNKIATIVEDLFKPLPNLKKNLVRP